MCIRDRSKGCHQLIKQGAKLVDDLHDIIDELGLNNLMIHHSFAADHSTNGADKGLFNANLSLLSLMGFEPISLDAIVHLSDLTISEVSSMLMLLELEGKVTSLVGGQYQRIV